MSHYNPYPAYRDSGVEWIGQVPEHWDVKRLGFYFDERREKVSDKDFPPLSVTMGGVVPQIEGVAKTEDNDNRKKVCSGDFVINSRSDRKGSSGLSELDGSVSLINTVLCPGKMVCGRFAHHLLRSTAFQEEYYRYGNGLVADLWTTHYSDMRNIGLGIPPLNEQSVIGSALDRETTRIDALITKKTRFIELLKEKRLALITQAVTKGLDPNMKMKDSGVEWIGEVPMQWAVSRLGHFATVENGTTPSKSCPEFWEGGAIPWLGSGEVNQRFVTEATEYITDLALSSCSLRLLPKGTVIIGMVGQGKTRGLAAILEIEAAINQNLAAVCTSKRLRPMFLLYVFLAAYDWLREAGRGSNQAAMNCEIIGEFRLALPPIAEQDQILSQLGKKIARIDVLVDKTQRSIDLLKERRAAFITAAVTGQIDLRESA